MKKYFFLLPLLLCSCVSTFDNDSLADIHRNNIDRNVLSSLPNGTEVEIRGKIQRYRKAGVFTYYIQFEKVQIAIDGTVLLNNISQYMNKDSMIKGIVKEKLYTPSGLPAVSANPAMQPKASSKYIDVYYLK